MNIFQSYSTYRTYQTQEMGIGVTRRTYSGVTCYTWLDLFLCVCVHVCGAQLYAILSHVWLHVIITTIKVLNRAIAIGPLMLPFYWHAHPQRDTYSFCSSYQLLFTCSLSVKLCWIAQVLCKHKYVVYTILRLAFFHSA